MTRGLLLGLVATAVGLIFAAVGSARPAVTVMFVVEHANTDTTTDTGKKGDSAGDTLTFANPIFDGADKTKVGTDNGFCTRTVARVAYECLWTTSLPRGQITVEGPFYDKENSELAITGGTRAYANARGWMEHLKRNEKQYDFVFHVS
jgi:hypothetical protein